MNGSAKKIAVIAVILVLVVAAIAVVVSNDDDDSNDGKLSMKAGLPVYGNADGDYTIDANDLSIVQKILNKEEGYTLEAYPYADTDYDGVVTQNDVDLLNKILNKESCTVYHGMNDGKSGWKVVDTKWPIEKAATSANPQLLMLEKMAGIIEDHIVGVTFSKDYGVDPYLYPTLQGMESLGATHSVFDEELVSECKSKKGITAIFASSNLKNADTIEGMGVDVIRMDQMTADIDRFVSQILLLGFLFEENNQAVEIGKWSEDLYAEMNTKLSTLKDDEKVTAVLNVGQTGSLVYKGSNYVSVLLQAGALYPPELDVSSSPEMGDWIYNMKFDKIMCMRNSTEGNSWYGGNPDYERYFEAVHNTLSLTDAYKNGEVYVIGLDMPLPIRIAYFSQALYPELYGEGWADGVHQDFIDRFFEEDFDVSQLDFLLDIKDYEGKLPF